VAGSREGGGGACLQPSEEQLGQRGELRSVVLLERDVVAGHEAVQHLVRVRVKVRVRVRVRARVRVRIR